MGALRLILALGVVLDHRAFYDPFFLIRGGVAVILFYIISGFYMSLVIRESYQPTGKGWEWRFLAQRAMRLYPAYWVVLAFSVFTAYIAGVPTPFTYDIGLGWFRQGAIIFSNVFLAGLDIQVATNTLIYASRGSFAFLWTHYPVFHAWTVAVELTFYVFAALFALRDTRSALVALACAVYIRIYFLIANGKLIDLSQDGIGLSNTPWGYHFFGTALIFFMLGWVAYQIYRYIDGGLRAETLKLGTVRMIAAALAAMLAFIAWCFDSFRTIADYNDYRMWVAVPAFVLLLPFLFAATKKSRADYYIGLFSYPVYLCHVVAPDAATLFFGMAKDKPWTTLVAVAIGSMLIVVLIEIPGDWARHKFGKRKQR